MPGLGEEGRIRAALGLGVSPEDIADGTVSHEHLRLLRTAHVSARLRRSGRMRPVAQRSDYPDTEQPMPPIPGGEGLAAALAAIDTISVRVDTGMRNFAVRGGHVIATLAKINASVGAHSSSYHGHVGPKNTGGPNVVSGELRDSITVGDPVQTGFGGFEWSVDVGPAIVYGRAIELGMLRPPDGYSSTLIGAGSKYYKRHPGFGGIYAFLDPARNEFMAQAEVLAEEEMTKALSG